MSRSCRKRHLYPQENVEVSYHVVLHNEDCLISMHVKSDFDVAIALSPLGGSNIYTIRKVATAWRGEGRVKLSRDALDVN